VNIASISGPTTVTRYDDIYVVIADVDVTGWRYEGIQWEKRLWKGILLE
tara:strand:+ start:844 stop:990 length:147 start_codon:yes stop_codon:yes gene_type:complete